MNKATKRFLTKVCEEYDIVRPERMSVEKIQEYMEKKLKEKGLSDVDVEFLNWINGLIRRI